MSKTGRTSPLFVSTVPAVPAAPGGGFLRIAGGALIGAAAPERFLACAEDETAETEWERCMDAGLRRTRR